jgi:hypothetical protein
MQNYNTSEYVANFYDKPSVRTATEKPPEILYNHFFKKLGISATFSYKFDKSVLGLIEQHFDLFSSDLTFAEDKTFEDSYWLGKGEFNETILFVSFMGKYEGLFVESDRSKDDSKVNIKAVCGSKQTALNLEGLLKKFKTVSKTNLYVLITNFGDLTLSPLPMKSYDDMDLSLNYGEDFLSVHDKVMKVLSTQESGLLLFNGEPGTGKSSYIKYLTSGIVKRKIVYIPVSLLNQLTSPQMLPLLTENRDIILVLEDAEKALVSRDSAEYTDIVQSVLNLTDGILGSALNVTIIATFNTDKDNIDIALLRKGRLKISYEFKKLTLEQSVCLAESLGKDASKINEGMTVADIYNLDEDAGFKKKEKARVGFCT